MATRKHKTETQHDETAQEHATPPTGDGSTPPPRAPSPAAMRRAEAAAKKLADKNAAKAAKEAEREAKSAAKSGKSKALTISERHMSGDLIRVLVREIREQQVPWGSLPEENQQKVIDRITKAVKDSVRACVTILAARGKQSVAAEVDSVTFKDAIRVVLTMSKTNADRHAIADATGQGVLLVLPDYSVVEGGDPVKPDPDQPRLAID